MTIAHYNLLEDLGPGGLGDVHRARDTKVGRTVALKLVPAGIVADPAQRAALTEDAQAAALLSHPNITTLFDVGDAGDRVFLAYEFAAGRPLAEEMAGGPMNPRHALDIAVQVADAVSDAHARGIIHTDLRPDTVIVTGKGSAKILDFGMARWSRGGRLRAEAARNPDALPPEARRVLAYLSPEQAIDSAVDARTDIFSIATIAYEMLTGRNPFLAPTAADTVMHVIQGKVPPPSDANPAVPPELDAILLKALARDLEQREQSAAALAAELRSVAAVLDVRTGDVADRSVLMPLDTSPDNPGFGLFAAAIGAAAGAAAAVWWYLSR
ncbi:MAG TPA: serine/threonine-protein kinase [Vicinamibacterales bacterium]|nr:serine/threonine-protein kinase [Vicinamibacterales bacterium]